MELQTILDALRAIAPESLAEGWDKVGLHAGDPVVDVAAGLLCIDLTEAVLEEAVAAGVQLIVAYHPPIFAPLGRVTTEQVKSRIIYRAIRHGIAIYSPHTALDAAAGGVNDFLAQGVAAGAAQSVVPVTPSATADMPAPLCKLVTFMPPGHVDAVRTALADAGAGWIGNYSHCSFVSDGTGTFLGREGARPAVGEAGRLERVAEQRLEMVCPRSILPAVVAALKAAHPYEEPAFDVLPLEAPLATGGGTGERSAATGQGRIVVLREPVALQVLVERIKALLGVAHLEVAAARDHPVRRIGLCAGAGGSLLEAMSAGAIDVFFTGEMRHHTVLESLQRGVSIILAGHTQTERPYLPVYRSMIESRLSGVKWHISEADRPPGAIV